MVEEYYQSSSVRAIVNKFFFNVRTVMKWLKKYNEFSLMGLRDKKELLKEFIIKYLLN